MRGTNRREILKEGALAFGLTAAAAFLLNLPALLAVFPGTQDTDLSDAASAYVRAHAPMLEHSHTLFFGFPFAAYPPHMAFYPPALLADRLLSSDGTFPALGIFHLLVAGLGMYAVARLALRTRPFPALLADLLLITCGYFSARRGQSHILASTAWMPVALAGAALYLRHRRLPGLPIAAGALALSLLAGHYQIVLYGSVMLGVSALCFSRRPGPIAAVALGAPMLAALIAGIGLLPAWDYLHQGNRSDLIAAQFDAYSFSFADFIGFLIPGAFGGEDGHLFSRRYAGRWNFHEAACYLGIAATGLAGAYLFARRRHGWRSRWLLVLIGTGLFIALGKFNPCYALFRHVPGFNLFRVPSRALFLVDIALSLGAALAFDRWLLRRDGRRAVARALKISSAVTALLVAALMLWWGYGRTRNWQEEPTWVQPRPWDVVARNLSASSHPHTPRLLIPLALAGVGWALSRRGPRALGGLILADAFLFAFCIGTRYPTDSPADRIPAKAILADAHKRGWDPSTIRVLADEGGNAYAYHGLNSVVGLSALFPKELGQVVPVDVHGILTAWPPPERLPRLGISYVVSSGKRLPPPPPSPLLDPVIPGLVYAVPSAQPLIRPSRSVTWEPKHLHASLPAGASGPVDILCRWDPSWRATVDGRAVKMERSGIFMRIDVRPGDHDLDVRYENPSYPRGRWVTAAGLVLFLGIVFLSSRSRGVE